MESNCVPFKMWMEAEHYSHFYTRKKMDDDLIDESAKKRKRKKENYFVHFMLTVWAGVETCALYLLFYVKCEN